MADETELLAVEQRHRDAGARQYQGIQLKMRKGHCAEMIEHTVAEIIHGRWDKDDAVQAFARFERDHLARIAEQPGPSDELAGRRQWADLIADQFCVEGAAVIDAIEEGIARGMTLSALSAPGYAQGRAAGIEECEVWRSAVLTQFQIAGRIGDGALNPGESEDSVVIFRMRRAEPADLSVKTHIAGCSLADIPYEVASCGCADRADLSTPVSTWKGDPGCP